MRERRAGFGRTTQGVQAGEVRRGSCASQSSGCCLAAVVEQFFTVGVTHARQQIQSFQEEFCKRFDVPTALAQMAGGEERGGEWEEKQAQRAASRQSQMGPPAPGGRKEGFPAGSVFDPTRFQDANGRSPRIDAGG